MVKFSEYGFPVRISFDEEYSRIVNHLFTIGITQIAFAHNDNPGAESASDSTAKFIAERGEHDGRTASPSRTMAPMRPSARPNFVKLKPKAVVLSATNDVTAKFIGAYRAAGGETAFYSFSFLNGQKLHQDIQKQAGGVVISQVVPYPWNGAMPLIAEYQAAMKKIDAKEFSYGSLEGFVAAKVMVEGLKRAGANPTAESLQKGLESFKALDLGGLTVYYRPGRAPRADLLRAVDAQERRALPALSVFRPRSVLLFGVVDRVLRDLDHQVLLRQDRLAATGASCGSRPQARSSRSSSLSSISLSELKPSRTIDVAGGAGAAHVAGVLDVDVVVQQRLADRGAGRRLTSAPCGQYSGCGRILMMGIVV